MYLKSEGSGGLDELHKVFSFIHERMFDVECGRILKSGPTY